MAIQDAVVLPKVLVVDDERGTRESLRFALQREYAVVTAGSVEEGLNFIGHEPFDAVVLDLRLPGLDGIEGLRRIRDLDPNVAVVILTAYASMDTAVQALRLGASDYRTKPFDVPDLLAVIRRHVGLTQMARRRESALAHDLQRVNDNLASRLVADERLAHVGRLAGALVHDLNGPLTNLTLSLDLLHGDVQHLESEPAATGQAVAGYIEDTRATLGLITDMIRSHQRFSHQRHREHLRLPLNDVLNAVLKVVRPLYVDKNCQIRRWIEPYGMTVEGERLALFRLFYNILVNALDAVPPEVGRIEIVCAADGDRWVVAIHDNGPGIPPESLKRLLDHQQFTTKPHGTGLGLAIVQSIVREHRGRLEIASTVGAGTTVSVRLPRPAGDPRLPPTAPGAAGDPA